MIITTNNYGSTSLLSMISIDQYYSLICNLVVNPWERVTKINGLLLLLSNLMKQPWNWADN